MTSREAFEAWISRPPFECSVARWPDDPSKSGWPGNYKKLDVQLAWCAWGDSRAYALTEAAALCDRKADDEWKSGDVDHNEIPWSTACSHDILTLRDREQP